MEMLLEDPNYRKLSHQELVTQYIEESLAPVLTERANIKMKKERLCSLLTGRNGEKNNRLSDNTRQRINYLLGVLETRDKHYQEMQSDMEYAISWMKNAHAPGVIRGIDRRAAYQNDKLMDPLIMQRYFRSEETTYSWDKEEKESSISTGDKIRIAEALSILTDKERELYLMHVGHSLSFAKIASNFKVSRQTVQATVKRAERKIANYMKDKKEEDCYEYSAAN